MAVYLSEVEAKNTCGEGFMLWTIGHGQVPETGKAPYGTNFLHFLDGINVFDNRVKDKLKWCPVLTYGYLPILFGIKVFCGRGKICGEGFMIMFACEKQKEQPGHALNHNRQLLV